MMLMRNLLAIAEFYVDTSFKNITLSGYWKIANVLPVSKKRCISEPRRPKYMLFSLTSTCCKALERTIIITKLY